LNNSGGGGSLSGHKRRKRHREKRGRHREKHGRGAPQHHHGHHRHQSTSKRTPSLPQVQPQAPVPIVAVHTGIAPTLALKLNNGLRGVLQELEQASVKLLAPTNKADRMRTADVVMVVVDAARVEKREELEVEQTAAHIRRMNPQACVLVVAVGPQSPGKDIAGTTTWHVSDGTSDYRPLHKLLLQFQAKDQSGAPITFCSRRVVPCGAVARFNLEQNVVQGNVVCVRTVLAVLVAEEDEETKEADPALLGSVARAGVEFWGDEGVRGHAMTMMERRVAHCAMAQWTAIDELAAATLLVKAGAFRTLEVFLAKYHDSVAASRSEAVLVAIAREQGGALVENGLGRGFLTQNLELLVTRSPS